MGETTRTPQWMIDNAVATAHEQMVRNTKEAAKMIRLLTAFGVDLPSKKLMGIKTLREQLGIGIKEAKDAWELAIELRSA